MADIRLDYDGIGEVLRVVVKPAIDELTAQVARNVDAKGRKVDTAGYTTDRAAGSVTIADPAGLGMQAKHGTLTKAAASLGLEVRAKR